MLPGLSGAGFIRSGAYRAIEYVGGRTQSWNGTTGNTVVALAGLTGGIGTQPAAGDLVIINYGTAGVGGNINVQCISAGWVEAVELYQVDSSETNMGVYWKIMGGTPDTSVTMGPTGGGNDPGAVVVHVWRGVDQTTPMDVTPTTATAPNSANANPPAITPVTTGAVVLACCIAGATTGVFTQPGSELSNFRAIFKSDTNEVTVGIGSFAWTGGSFNPVAWVGPGSNIITSWCAATLALRPGPA